MGTGARPRGRSTDRTRRLGGLVGVGLLATALSGLACGSKTAASDGGQDLIPKTDVPELGTGIHSSCPTTLPGPAMTRVGWHGGVAFCIDDTEVTNSQYQTFLTAAATTPPAPAARCAWNTELTPAASGSGCAAFDPTGRPDHPVVCVDWCDADAYCRWAGKYLCRAASLEGENAGPVKNPTADGGSQWILACTNDGASTYPYGSEGSAGRCVDKKYPSTTSGVQPVKTATLCEGGVPGIFDMSGNASEWQDDCVEAATSTDGRADECDAYGGARSSEYADTSCLAATASTDTAAHFTRAAFAADNGFRCCANAMFF